MIEINSIGVNWLSAVVGGMTDLIPKFKPSEYVEKYRYLPESVSSIAGPYSYDVNPFMREPVDCFDPDSDVREVSLMKGVQLTYTTGALEAAVLYGIGHIRTIPIGYVTAERELAQARRENNFLPMIHQSGFSNCIQSSDSTNTKKTGNTTHQLQWRGGGYAMFLGANNPAKGRQTSYCWMLMDEVDAWPILIGRDGDPVRIFYDRTQGYNDVRKVFMGSTPLLKGSSKIERAFLRGDQRRYFVPCLKCGRMQYLRWKDDHGGGFVWELDSDNLLVVDSVGYRCDACGHVHREFDKFDMFSPDNGAEWRPTARPVADYIRSYHLPAFYSPVGMQSWAGCVQTYLDAFDVAENKVKDIGLFQVFYNNVLAKTFELTGARVSFSAASRHRRVEYKLGEVPNRYATEHAGGLIKFLTCTVDVHKRFLSVAIMGWVTGARCFLVDYFRLTDEVGDSHGCTSIDSNVWTELENLLDHKVYQGDDGEQYRIFMTLIDANYGTDTVVNFCGKYADRVHPILGASFVAKKQSVREFGEWTTPIGTSGYRVVVDYYKDRLAPVLRRHWKPDLGTQKFYHFNCPVDTTNEQIKELTVEKREKETDKNGVVSYRWVRPDHARNELWDLLVYGHAAVEILAWKICVDTYQMEFVDWHKFWNYAEFV